ncbi:helix-turn-helix domain-containing protein [Microlunatus parietis]|uniref:DNA-binding transcriptional MerR regulator n=1 Tax=Microlunatus parietis TaxID=682979 RepID=A0A7Y9LAW8_9ACTN|nr:MerR family transcriptional regulator [Microlunatus parietis]NYE70020.1 DNA-binding transcriptional MerR regulator [Microlunatus parietis]
MAWSTRQLAELAGTTLKAVRHYHEVGLLEEPERAANGYKQYGVAHLVRLLRIRRLTDLGLSLPQIAAMGNADEHPEQALRLLDSELAATIERLQRIRAELALILRQSLPTDLPPELADVSADLTEADRALIVVYGRVLGPEGIEAMRRMLAGYQRTDAAVEFDELPADADEDTRRGVADRLFPHYLELIMANPDIATLQANAPRGLGYVTKTVNDAMADVFNPAQLDVLERVGEHFRRRTEEAGRKS